MEKETDWIRVKIQKDGRIAVPKSLREYHRIKPGNVISIKIRREEE